MFHWKSTPVTSEWVEKPVVEKEVEKDWEAVAQEMAEAKALQALSTYVQYLEKHEKSKAAFKFSVMKMGSFLVLNGTTAGVEFCKALDMSKCKQINLSKGRVPDLNGKIHYAVKSYRSVYSSSSDTAEVVEYDPSDYYLNGLLHKYWIVTQLKTEVATWPREAVNDSICFVGLETIDVPAGYGEEVFRLVMESLNG
jgi:hypothetical protein